MLFQPFQISTKRRLRQCGGWTFMEMMVALACGTIVMLAFIATTISVATTMMAAGNYNDLNKSSRNTLDWLSRDVRNSTSVGASSSSTSVIITNSTGATVITYAWDGSNVLSRTEVNSGSSIRTMMLTNCEIFSFSYYQRNPTNNFAFVSTTNPAQIKLVSVSWRCSRRILGAKLNTESVQTATVVMRN